MDIIKGTLNMNIETFFVATGEGWRPGKGHRFTLKHLEFAALPTPARSVIVIHAGSGVHLYTEQLPETVITVDDLRDFIEKTIMLMVTRIVVGEGFERIEAEFNEYMRQVIADFGCKPDVEADAPLN